MQTLKRTGPAELATWENVCDKYRNAAFTETLPVCDALSVFDNFHVPLCDRLWFAMHPNSLPLSASMEIVTQMLRPIDKALSETDAIPPRVRKILDVVAAATKSGEPSTVPGVLAQAYVDLGITATAEEAWRRFELIVKAGALAHQLKET